MKTKHRYFFLVTFLVFSLFTNVLMLIPQNKFFSKAPTSGEQILADVTEWRYKTEEGKLYKRLYNVTRQTWSSGWFYVCEYPVD